VHPDGVGAHAAPHPTPLPKGQGGQESEASSPGEKGRGLPPPPPGGEGRGEGHATKQPHDTQPPPVVLDTNILLDLFIFRDPATRELRAALDAGDLCFIATAVMREELRRVLDYPQLQPRMAFYGITAEQVLAAFDRHVRLRDVAPKAAYTCKDADDQKFLDLAAAHQARLISKDKAVLSMARRMKTLGVAVAKAYIA